MIEYEDLDEDSADDAADDSAERLAGGSGGWVSSRGQFPRRTAGAGWSMTIARPWLVLALVGAAVVGFAVGRWSSPSGSPAAGEATTSSTQAPDHPDPEAPLVDGQLNQAAHCASQTGKLLQVGIQVLNQTGQPAAFSLIRVDLPLSGFTVVQAGFGACSEMANDGRDEVAVPAGGAVWVSALLRPTVRCITPLPVRFRADVQTGQQTSTVTLGGFSDLGGVTWSGCPAASSQFS